MINDNGKSIIRYNGKESNRNAVLDMVLKSDLSRELIFELRSE